MMRPDQAEFAEFYATSRDACLRAVVAGVGDRDVADDLVADAFAKAWNAWPKVRRHPAPRAWVVRTALNAGVSRWRKRRRERPLADCDAVAPAMISENVVDVVLMAALRELSQRQREVIALRVFLDLDAETTAQTLGIAAGTVSAHLARAIATLRRELTIGPGELERSTTRTVMNEYCVMERVQDALAGVHMYQPVEAIIAKGSARRRRHVVGLAMTVVALGGVLTAGLLTVNGSDGASSVRNTALRPTGSGQAVHVRLAGFWLDSYPSGGGGTLTLIKGGPIDANVLRQDLANAGIPAVVTAGQFCENHVGDSSALVHVISSRRQTDGTVLTTFASKAIPDGLEITIGVFPGGAAFGLATANASLTCNRSSPHFG
jgi:RNA polymerase sigma factor (sigma-70 family)